MIKENWPKTGEEILKKSNMPKIGEDKMIKSNTFKIGEDNMIKTNTPYIGEESKSGEELSTLIIYKYLNLNKPNVGEDIVNI